MDKRRKIDAHITKKGSSFNLYVDGDKLDSYKSEKEAEKAANEFAKLLG